jgi:hypothetical protein
MSIQENSVPNVEPIRNKVAESGIVTLDLSNFLPTEETLGIFDLKDFLFMGMILREKDYRAGLQSFDWSVFQGKHVGIVCTADAVIPVWAYMLATVWLKPVASSVHFASGEMLKNLVIEQNIRNLDVSEFADKRVVLKGCGDVAVPETAYVSAAAQLLPVVKSLMYGEPCSTVPVYKQAVQR